MRVIFGYVRVSSIEQERGYGPEAQATKIREYCAQQDLGSPEIIHESRSGESITQRHEFNSMLARGEAAAEEGHEVHIIFPGLDRLSRNLIDQESAVLRCASRGIRLHSALGSENDTLDPAFSDDPMRTAIRQFWGIIHQLDRAIIQRRLDGGLARKASSGGFTGGRPPFGYRSVNKELVIDEDQAPVVRRVFGLKEHGIDQATTAAILAREFPQTCGRWHKRQVGRILERADLYRSGQYRSRVGVQPVVRPDLVIVDGAADEAPAPAGGIDWDRMPDTVQLHALATLIGAPQDRLRAIISQEMIVARHRKGSIYLSKRDAKRVAELVKSLS